VFYGDEKLHDAVKSATKKLTYKSEVSFINLNITDTEEFNQLKSASTDLIVFIKARQNSVSYSWETKSILTKLEQLKAENSLLIISPNQHE
ncbi:MAG: hypothetical protein ACK5JD_17135, partial [Mangrovibacterium sp.]